MIGFKKLAQKTTNLLLALALVSAQLFAPLSAIVPKANAVHPSPVYDCVNDTAGPNDEPGQKDLNTLCVDDTHLPQEVDVTWNWDETGTTGENSMDACSLFDTDSDGRANYSVCVVTNGTPAVETATVLYSCGDDKPDRCTSPVTPLTITGNTSCDVVSPSPDDPFAGTGNAKGDDFPNDTKARCTLDLSDVGGVSAAELIDVCSYPSQQPNSDPSDCVIIKDTTAFISLVKQIVPETDNGLFNLLINGQVKANDVSDNGTTGIVNVEASGSGQGTVFTVSETAGTNTSLSGYTSNVQCTKEDKNGTPTVGPNVSGTSTTVALKPAEEAVCIFTNTRAGSITIVKDAIPNDAQDFAFTATGTGVSNFSLDDDANGTLVNTQTFSNLSAGTYTFTEASVAGWYLDNIECPNITETKDLTTGQVSLTISAGQNITCTFTNRKLGQLVVTKQTNPNGDQQTFSITASGTNTISGNATRDIVDDETETYMVRHGEYDVNEQDIAGWTEDDSACQNLVIDGNTPLVNGIPTRSCTITNTKLATLNIIKNALPDHEQDFAFITSGTGLSNFSLDDDSDGTLPNQVTFSNLTPNQQYSVTEQSTPGWSLTGLSCNDIVQQGSTATITPTPGQTITCTFTNTKLISVSGTKFEVDAGATDGGLGTILGGWTIFIDSNNNGELDPGEQSDVTDENGNYSFSDLLYGTTITLREVLKAGWTQIFGPATFTLDTASDVTDKDFGNFENATINGFKWNDKNADDAVNDGEEKLNGWTITLYNDGQDADTELDDAVSSTVTTGEGAYSFNNLAPGTYAVCETQQTGWVQTYPNDNGCHIIVINVSGETEQANFGNQGRGTITVNKNVDTDGDGDVDITGATNWAWDIAGGAQNTATGSSQNVAAGTYTVSEDQKTDFHFVSVSCSGEEQLTQGESVSITVSAGENVICTFVNARDTGTIEVRKELSPEDNDGVFDLRINDVTEKEDASDGDTTGVVSVMTGVYDVKELAGNEFTDLSNYDTTLTCTRNGQTFIDTVSTTDSDDFSVGSNDEIVCTFTNTAHGKIIVVKDAVSVNDDDLSQDFCFTVDEADLLLTIEDESLYDEYVEGCDGFLLDDDNDETLSNSETIEVSAGWYTITEEETEGWDLADIDCDNDEVILFDSLPGYSYENYSRDIFVAPGQTVTCIFVNEKRAEVVVTKYNDYNRNERRDDGEPLLPEWGFNLQECESEIRVQVENSCNGNLLEESTGSEGEATEFDSIKPGAYDLTEDPEDGWYFSDAHCVYQVSQTNGFGGYFDEEEEIYRLYVSPGAVIECEVGNYRDAYMLIEKTNNRPNPTSVGDTVTYTLTVTVPEDSNPVYDATVTDLPPEGFEYIPGSETATKGSLTSPYASPGVWSLGDLFPGEIVTLTYQTRIANSTSPGTYPDLAFASGCDDPRSIEESGCEVNVYANVTNIDEEGSPFVGTQVTIKAPQVLAANTTVLVNTGTADIWRNLAVGTLLIGVALATLYRREQKGGRA